MGSMVILMNQRRSLEDLVREARQGGRNAFDEIAGRLGSRLRSVIQLQLGKALEQRTEVDDVLQETFLRAFQSISGCEWRGEEAFVRWLTSISRHVVLELAARDRRGPPVPLDDDVIAPGLSQSRALRREERFERLEDAVRALPPDYRKVVLLARVEGLPVQEIALRMGRTPNAVSHLLLRALEQLRETFGDTESCHLPDWTFKQESDRHDDE